MREHDGVKYKIETTDVTIASSSEHEEYKTGYVYTLIDAIDTYCGYEDYESDEWFDDESEAVIAAENKIAWFHDGMEYEGNYEERMAMKPREIDWDERRRMGE